VIARFQSRLPGQRRAGFGVAAQRLLLGAVPAAVTAWLAYSAIRYHWFALDFYSAYYPAAHRLLDGASPYAVTHSEVVAGSAFVYPALSAVAFVPFALVSRGLSDHLYTLVCFICVLGTLRAAHVKDWRVYGVTLLWFPIIIGWQGENVSVPLMFLVALVWRHRDRPAVAGLIAAAAISLKPFVWPLGLWLLATRRWTAAAWTLGFGLALNLLAWGIVGFSEVHTYLHLSGEVVDALWRRGYGMLAVAHYLGFGRCVGDGLLVVLSIAVAAAIVREGFFEHREREAMVLTVALMLVASPLVWMHYFVLLLVPLALTRRRFSAVWAAPLVMWASPSGTSVAGWQAALAWIVVAMCLGSALQAREPARPLPGGTAADGRLQSLREASRA
jgi:hypothetical protein